MIKAEDAIRTARGLLGTPYSSLDCIGLIKQVIRTAPGGVKSYTTAGTNTLWKSRNASAKYRDLTWTQETSSALRAPSPEGKANMVCAQAGMLAFKRSGEDVHHVGLVTGDGTVVHSSSVYGKVVETALDSAWQLLAKHRYIETQEETSSVSPAVSHLPQRGRQEPENPVDEMEGTQMEAYRMVVAASSLNVRKEPGVGGERIGRLSEGAVVTVQEEMDNGWMRITYGDSGAGYVDGSYLAAYTEPTAAAPEITIIDSAGNAFRPVGDWRVLIGSID